MALRLVREASDTPNITNKDDTIMTRYAYGGYNGVVKAFGNECDYIADSGIFKILSARILVDGWEIDVDGAGYQFDFSGFNGTQYNSIYLEINVATEDVSLKSTYETGKYPEIGKGDDLTSVQNGTANLLLYNVKVENGVISEVVKRFNIIPYLTQKVIDIEERLSRLGFKQGKILNEGLAVGTITRQGNYVLIDMELDLDFGEFTFNIVNENNEPTNDFAPESENLMLLATIGANIYLQDFNKLYCIFQEQQFGEYKLGYEAKPI